MKSYFLKDLQSIDLAKENLTKLLQGGQETWVLLDLSEDPMAYFYIVTGDEPKPYIQVDMSGRHYNRDKDVLNILRQLKLCLGGAIHDEDDEELS